MEILHLKMEMEISKVMLVFRGVPTLVFRGVPT